MAAKLCCVINAARCIYLVLGNRIINQRNPNEVLDIVGGEGKDGATLCAYQYKGTKNQHFQMDYTGGPPPQSRPFYIRSEMHNKVIDIDAANAKPGAKVRNCLLWY